MLILPFFVQFLQVFNAKQTCPINNSLKEEILLELNLMNSLHRRIFTGINGQKSLGFKRVTEIRSCFMQWPLREDDIIISLN